MHPKIRAVLLAAAVAGLAAAGVSVDPATLGVALDALTSGCGAAQPESPPAADAGAPDSGVQ